LNAEDDKHLYDRVARLQEELGPEALARIQPVIEGESGEGCFTRLVQQHVDEDDAVVDIGTGAGTWLLKNVAPRVRRAVGLDYARRRYRFALRARRELRATNADFLLADARRIPLRDGAATAVISRRGPWTANEAFFAEGSRILARGGLGLEISIGEQNARELDASFGARAQCTSRMLRAGAGSRTWPPSTAATASGRSWRRATSPMRCSPRARRSTTGSSPPPRSRASTPQQTRL
jgi:hypothetical protein